jgi:hypothetical protein
MTLGKSIRDSGCARLLDSPAALADRPFRTHEVHNHLYAIVTYNVSLNEVICMRTSRLSFPKYKVVQI